MSVPPRVGTRRLVAMIAVGLAIVLTTESVPEPVESHEVASNPQTSAILAYIVRSNPGVPASDVRSYAAALPAIASEFGLDHCLALAQAEVESLFSPDAVGGAGEIGLYQILPRTGALFGRDEHQLFDPRVNTRVALGYFRDILSRKPALRDALAEYNGGPRNRSPFYALTVLEAYTRVLRHRDLDCAPDRNPLFAAPTHVLPAGVSRTALTSR